MNDLEFAAVDLFLESDFGKFHGFTVAIKTHYRRTRKIPEEACGVPAPAEGTLKEFEGLARLFTKSLYHFALQYRCMATGLRLTRHRRISNWKWPPKFRQNLGPDYQKGRYRLPPHRSQTFAPGPQE